MINLNSDASVNTAMHKTLIKRPLTLVLAGFFLLSAILPLVLLFSPTPNPASTDTTQVAYAENTINDNLTINEKMTGIAEAIENACYSNGTEDTKQFFEIGTWIMFAALTTSSLVIAALLLIVYINPSVYQKFRSVLLSSWLIPTLAGVLVIAVMHIYSAVLIGIDFSKLNETFPAGTKAKDTRTTELVFYMLRNLLITAGFSLFLYKLPRFILNCNISDEKNARKTYKNAKGLVSGCTATALICCLFASTISLTWVFDFTTKALLAITILLAVNSFIMIGFVHDIRKKLKQAFTENKSAE